MKKISFWIFMMLMSVSVFSQTFNMQDGTVTTCSGVFYDSGGGESMYSNNEYYEMTFTSEDGSRLSFNFQTFYTESGYDKLKIYDGPNTSYPMIGEYSGSNSPGLVISTGESITFIFYSDGSNIYSGWSAIISCTTPALTEYTMNSTTVTTCEALFTDSGGSSGDYQNNEDVVMTFCSGSSDYVTAKFIPNDFSIASGDTLYAYDGSDINAPLIGAYYGNRHPEDISSISGSCLTFRFKSNTTGIAKGWRAIIGCSSTPIVNGEFKMMQGIRYTCGGVFYDSGGPNGNYSNNEGSSMTFVSTNGNRLKFNFQSFYTESGYDKLYIYDGPTINHPRIGVYDGGNSPGLIESTGNTITFYFSSETSNTYSGWSANISCTTPALPEYIMSSGTINTCEAVFYDIGGPSSEYLHNGDNTMTFCSDNSDFINFTFRPDNFKIHTSDTLFVYDGTSTSDAPIGAYTGTGIPEVISSKTGSCLTFRFVTNATGSNIGWQALIDCADEPVVPHYNMQNGIRYTCEGIFYDSGGVDGVYGRNESVTETFISSSGERLKFDFQSFSVEFTDKLYIYDGPNSNYPLIGVYSGSNAPGIVRSTGDALTFYFSSDGSTEYSGWVANIECDGPSLPVYIMSNETVTSCEGVFYDSGGPAGNYMHNDQKEMTFCSGSDDFISVRFQEHNFNIHNSDTLFVFDGSNSSAPPIGTYYGDKLPELIYSKTGSCLTFKFKSNAINSSLGWQGIIECSPTPYEPQDYLMQEGVRYTCGGNFYDSGGPDGNYSNNSMITETFISDNGNRLKVDFAFISMESNFDRLVIFDGPSDDYPFLAILTGTTAPPAITASGDAMTFRFISDGTNVNSGWAAQFSCTDEPPLPTYNMDNGTITTCEAMFYDSGGPTTEYSNGENKVMTFCSEDGSFMKVDFGEYNFGIVEGDILKIYDGPSTSSTPLAILHGFIDPEVITSINSSCLTFEFISNPTSVAMGWRGHISCVDEPIINTEFNIKTGGTRYVCGASFYDSGGPGGNYGKNEDYTMSFCSTNDCSITAEINHLHTENNYDYLSIYNGIGTENEDFIDVFSGTHFSTSITSSGQCLTFRFTSDNAVFNAGWYISLVCDKATITSNTDGVACNGETVILTANEGVSYLWSTGETTQSIAVTTPGYYSVQVLTSENCNFVSDPFFVEFAAVQAPTITPSGTITVCPGVSVNLISSQGQSYEWSNASTSQSTNVVETGDYWVSVTDVNGCVAVSDIVTIENYETAPIDISPSGNISICYGDSVQISTTASEDILWSTGATTQSIYVSEVGTYNVSAPDASGCMSISNNLNISFYNPEPPTITPSEPQTICDGNTTVLSSSSGIAYNWSTGENTQSISVQEAGNYWVVVTDANNCSRASAPVSINVNPNPPTPIVTATDALLQSSITSGYSFQWYYNGEAIAGATNSFYMATQNGLYFVELTDNIGCSTLSAPYNLQGVGIEGNSLSNSVKLYPNPFINKSTLVINSPKATTISIDCMDMLGRKIANIYQGDIPSGIFQIEINAQALGLSSGNYLLNIRSNEEVMQYKISISK